MLDKITSASECACSVILLIVSKAVFAAEDNPDDISCAWSESKFPHSCLDHLMTFFFFSLNLNTFLNEQYLMK